MKSRVKTWQVRGIWSQQLERKQVPKRVTEPGVRKGKRSLVAWHTRYILNRGKFLYNGYFDNCLIEI